MELKMYIGGQWVDAASGARMDAVSPVDGRVLASLPCAGPADADMAVRVAERDFHPWYHKTQEERSDIMCAMAANIRKNASGLAETLALETGTPVRAARRQAEAAAHVFEKNAWLARNCTGEQLPSTDSVAVVIHEAVGVAVLITGWSRPLFAMAEKIAEAIAMGNACVLKCSELCALTAAALVEAITDVKGMPVGVVNLVTGAGEDLSFALAEHPLADIISFTGSAEAGVKLMARSAASAKKCLLDMRANNPAIVLDDAPTERAAKELGELIFSDCGQRSDAPGRIYVHERVYERFLNALTDVAKNVRVGDPLDENTDMGPVAGMAHRDRVEGLVSRGLEEGAVMHYRAPGCPEKGAYVMPTVLTGCTRNMTPVRQEIFGPVAVVIKYTDEDNLLMLINDSDCGMCGYVWTAEADRGMEFINYLNVGALLVNCRMDMENQPRGSGVKLSGIGKHGGTLGFLEYTNPKLVCIKYK